MTARELPSSIVCSGCGTKADPFDAYPFRCPNAGGPDDIDHVMVRLLDHRGVRFPAPPADGFEANPFIRYRGLFHSYHVALACGMDDMGYVDLVRGLDAAVAGVDGRGFAVTPLRRHDELSARLGFDPEGGVWLKDETGSVSGSHKARHLLGLMVHLLVAERVGLTSPSERPRLAIASCGNAALAAAVVAAAAAWPLEVFVPVDADPSVVARLKERDALVTTCPREEGVRGDPTVRRLWWAILAGALPFTTQGNANGLSIEGGLTLGYEMADDLRDQGVALGRLFVQVGGGALATACDQGLREAVALGALSDRPALHAVQTEGAAPLVRAHRRLAERIEAEPSTPPEGHLRYAATHRSEFMWPWEQEPRSAASGILDDETYDWLAVVRGMVETGGWPIVVGEQRIDQANALAREATASDVDHTGSSGLAGLMAACEARRVASNERVAILFTGVARR